MFSRLLQLTILLCGAGNAAAQPLQYTITPDLSDDGKKRLLEVAAEFYPNRSNDTTWFRLPTRLNWTDNLQRCFRNFRVEGKGGRYIRHPQHDDIVGAVCRGEGPFVLRYEIWQNFFGEQVTVQTSNSPILQHEYVHVPGQCLFLRPSHYQEYEVRIEWKGLPKNWTIQNSFNSGQTVQTFKALDNGWVNSVWVAGDFRLLRGEVLGKPVFFALRGRWVFDDQTLFDVILKTIETQRSWWADTDIPYYSVTMIPFVKPARPVPGAMHNADCLGFGGFNSFCVYASDDCILDKLIALFNHEMMHDWIGGKIEPGEYFGAESLRWFAEGFTEYLALRNCWSAGLFTQADFFEELNAENFARHYADPAGERSAADVEACFYLDPECEDIPYRRGLILAFYFDAAIRQKSNNDRTLQDFMRALFEEFYGSRSDLGERFELFTELLGEALGGEDPTVFLNTHAFSGKLIPPEAFRLPECLQMTVNAQGAPQFALKPGRPTAEQEFLAW